MNLLSILYLLNIVFANTITTTLNSYDQKSVAIVEQASFIQEVLLDAVLTNARYTSVMVSKGIDIPPQLVQFILELNQDDKTAFPTSLYIKDFPFTQFQTFITHFPWITTFLMENGLTQFKVPSDYQTMIITDNSDDSNIVTSTSTNTELPSSLNSMLGSTTSTNISTSTFSSLTFSKSSRMSISTPENTLTSKISSASSSVSVSSISSTSQNQGELLNFGYLPHFFITLIIFLI